MWSLRPSGLNALLLFRKYFPNIEIKIHKKIDSAIANIPYQGHFRPIVFFLNTHCFSTFTSEQPEKRTVFSPFPYFASAYRAPRRLSAVTPATMQTSSPPTPSWLAPTSSSRWTPLSRPPISRTVAAAGVAGAATSATGTSARLSAG